MKVSTFGRRFYIFTAVGYLSALVACTAIVWTLAAPFLDAAQREYLEDAAQQQAAAAAFLLDETYDRAESLTRVPSVVDLVNGSLDSTSAVSDQIRAFSRPEMREARILDYEGRTLFAYRPYPTELHLFQSVEFGEEFALVGETVPGSKRPGRLRLRRSANGDETHLLIAVPVKIAGEVEGAVVLEKLLNLRGALRGDSQLITDFQKQLESNALSAVTAPVPGLPFHVRLDRNSIDTVAGASATHTLVARISFGLSFVLLLPFLAMLFFGSKHLVAPTEALARSRERMAEQQTQLERQSEELRELAAVAELSHDAISVSCPRGRIIWINEAFSEMTGYSQEEVQGRTIAQFLLGPSSDLQTVFRIKQSLDAGKPVREELLVYKKNRQSVWVALSFSPITDENGEVHRYAAISSDISERRAAQQALAEAQKETEYRATHDNLSGLPNRRFLDNVLEEEVTSGATPRTLIRADLDFFKNVNDTHGHAAGDFVLQVVSDILKRHSRKGDLVARVGGDEFVVLLVADTTTEEADALCERYRAEICQDIVFEGKTCRVGASFGVASALDGLVGNEELLVGADAALYVSKSKGRNTTTLYTPRNPPRCPQQAQVGK